MDTGTLWANPLVHGALFPLVLSFAATGLIRLAGGGRMGVMLACAAVGLAWLCTHAVILGLPPIPPRAAAEKLFVLAAAALVLAVLLEFTFGGRVVPLATGIGLIVVGLWWLGASRLGAPSLSADWLRYGLLAAAGIVVLLRLEGRSRDGIASPVMLLVATLAVGALAIQGSSAAVGQLAFGLAAALGGFMLWNWPVGRYPFRQAGLLGAGLPFVFIAGQITFYSDVPPAALALVLPVFFADSIAWRWSSGRSALAQASRPVLLGLIALLPAAAALALAWWLGGNDDPYYL